jgi:hypothetical protein
MKYNKEREGVEPVSTRLGKRLCEREEPVSSRQHIVYRRERRAI